MLASPPVAPSRKRRCLSGLRRVELRRSRGAATCVHLGDGIADLDVGAHAGVGLALIFAGTGSMLAAALVLLLSSPDKARAAITQGILPLIAIVLLGVGLAM